MNTTDERALADDFLDGCDGEVLDGTAYDFLHLAEREGIDATDALVAWDSAVNAYW